MCVCDRFRIFSDDESERVRESVCECERESERVSVCVCVCVFVCVIVSVVAGTMADVRIVGALNMADEKGEDQKLLAVPLTLHRRSLRPAKRVTWA